MTLQEMIERQRGTIATRLEARAAQAQIIQTIRDGLGDRTVLNTDETSRSQAAMAEVSRIDTEVGELRSVLTQWENEQRANEAAAELSRQVGAPTTTAGVGGARTQSPAVYRADNAHERSFFQDAYRAQMKGDWKAQQRLGEHGEWMRDQGGLTERAITTGALNGLVPPQYLTDQYAAVIRKGRPFANAIGSLPLPSEGMALVIPKGTSGATVASQATQNTGVSNTDPVQATDITVPVVTIAGYVPASRQSLERGHGVDSILFADIAGAYSEELDRQTLAGTGSSGQMLGVLATSGTYAATAFAAAATGPLLNTKIAGQIGAITGTGAGIIPDLIVMHPRRWAWITSLVDSSNRPLFPYTAYGPANAMGLNVAPGKMGADPDPIDGLTYVGNVQGIDVLTDASIPTNVGAASGGEDQVLIVDRTKLLLWEDSKTPQQLRFEQPLGSQLTVQLVGYGYAAFTAARYPVAVGKIGGLDTTTNGLVAPTF